MKIAFRTREQLLAEVGRWTETRWNELIFGARRGVITKAEACARHRISDDEYFRRWLDYEQRLGGGPARGRRGRRTQRVIRLAS